MTPTHSCSCHDDCCCECHCHDQAQFHRRFQTRAEQAEELQAYLQELETEVVAVKERLAELKSPS